MIHRPIPSGETSDGCSSSGGSMPNYTSMEWISPFFGLGIPTMPLSIAEYEHPGRLFDGWSFRQWWAILHEYERPGHASLEEPAIRLMSLYTTRPDTLSFIFSLNIGLQLALFWGGLNYSYLFGAWNLNHERRGRALPHPRAWQTHTKTHTRPRVQSVDRSNKGFWHTATE